VLRLAYALEVHVVLAGDVCTARVVLPVHVPRYGDVLLAGDHGLGTCDRLLSLELGCVKILVGKGVNVLTVVVLHLGHVGVVEDVEEHVELTAVTEL